ncbi:TetR/AcrR family transcriptional regulator [Paracoccaceae bacterium]
MLHSTPTPPAAEQRIAEIIASVRTAFAEKGFDGASMQDLARAAGMSVGNFYRYFPSKSAIVSALISHDLAAMEQDFAAVIAAPRPLEALRSLLHRRIPEHQTSSDGKLWAEITAAAQRKPEIGEPCCQMEAEILSYLTQIFATETGLSPEIAHQRFGAHAAFIIVLFKSSSMIAPGNPQLHGHLNAMILRTIDQTLDEISASRPKVLT